MLLDGGKVESQIGHSNCVQFVNRSLWRPDDLEQLCRGKVHHLERCQ